MLNVFVLSVLIATLASIFLLIHVINRHSAEKAFFLIFLSFSIFLYTFGHLLEITASSLEAAFYGVRVQYMGLPFIFGLFYLFSRDFFGKKRLPLFIMILIFIIPILNALTLQLYPYSRLYYKEIRYISNGIIANCTGEMGPFYLLGAFHNYLIFLLNVTLIIKHLKNSSPHYRKQAYTLLASSLIPVFVNIFYLAFRDVILFDPNPFSASVSLVLILYAVSRLNLVTAVPLARAQVIESMENAFVVCDENLHFLDANLKAKELFPELDNLPVGSPLEHLSSLYSNPRLELEKDGEKKIYKLTQSTISQGPNNRGICIILHDVTEEELLMEKLNQQATVDSLMGIYNRSTFFQSANTIIENEGQRISLALLLLDIDNFKQVNDIYGHQYGDAVLKSMGELLKEHFPADAVTGRYGGEETTVLLKDMTAPEAFSWAESFRKHMESESHCISYKGYPLHVTVSIGVSHRPPGDGLSLERMLSQADKAMYRAKNAGRNRSYLYGEL